MRSRAMLERAREEREELELRRRLSIDSIEARAREERCIRDKIRHARKVNSIPVWDVRGRSRKTEALLAAAKDAAFYRLLAGRLEEIDHAATAGARPAIAIHALTTKELQDLDRAALQTLDGEIRSAAYTPPKGSTT